MPDLFYKDEPAPATAPKHKPACPHGKESGTLIICTAPPAQTGASADWMDFERTGIIVTPWFCANSCRKVANK